MSLSVRFDYFQGTGFCLSISDFEDFLNSVCDFLPLGDSWAFSGHGIHIGESFGNSFRSVRGKLYGGIREESSGDYRYLLQIPGSYFAQLDSDHLIPLTHFLLDSGFNFTRCDIAVDDYSRRVSFEEIKRVGEVGDYRLVDSYKCIESSILRGTSLIPTCYFGSADKQLRFYNAEIIHGIKADRWELQLRNDHARSVVNDYLSGSSLGQFVTGAVDFGQGDRCETFRRFDWWQSLALEVGGTSKICLPDFIPCFERSLSWLYNQVAPTLAVAYYGYGQDKFQDLVFGLIADGAKRLKPYHNEWIIELRKEFDNV